MMKSIKSKLSFSTFDLKFIACVSMLIDHTGMVFFHDAVWMRVVGRIAFPIFAFLIAQGCRYTKNRLRRFLSVFVLGVLCEIGYVVFTGQYYGNVLLTFSVSILLIYLLDSIKRAFYHSRVRFVLLCTAFLCALAATYAYLQFWYLEYGFFGVLAPVALTLFDRVPDSTAQKHMSDKAQKVLSMCAFTVALVMIIVEFFDVFPVQLFSLIALVPVWLYNGELGRYKLKYAFYLFYPLHIAALQGIEFIVDLLAK